MIMFLCFLYSNYMQWGEGKIVKMLYEGKVTAGVAKTLVRAHNQEIHLEPRCIQCT